jgi:NAD(P)-dependent dehydrogenase (short-subunit alcohol dehydrogenase family)
MGNMDNLGDATVVITGASSGIGLAAARAFAARGANVVLAARRRDLLEQGARNCEALGTRALAVPTDVTDPDQVRELADAAVSAFGTIDVWVNNAGTSMWGRFEEIPLESQSRLVELNLLGAINGSHAVQPHFFERGDRGVIVNVSSIFGRVPMPFAAAYSASKAGSRRLHEALRAELAPRSEIEVSSVYPAYVDTPTYLNSADYTGCALRPMPPVVLHELGAERIVGLVLRPRRSARRHAPRVGRAVRDSPRCRREAGGPVGRALPVRFGTRGTGLRWRPFRDGSGKGGDPR